MGWLGPEHTSFVMPSSSFTNVVCILGRTDKLREREGKKEIERESQEETVPTSGLNHQ